MFWTENFKCRFSLEKSTKRLNIHTTKHKQRFSTVSATKTIKLNRKKCLKKKDQLKLAHSQVPDLSTKRQSSRVDIIESSHHAASSSQAAALCLAFV